MAASYSYFSLITDFIAYAFLYFILFHFVKRFRLGKNQAPRLPPGPKGWPVVGALPLLGNMPHVALACMAKRYGPVMYLKLGAVGVVVASTPDAAKVFLKTLDVNFSNRPIDSGPTNLAYGGQDLVFAEYGPRWKLLRKLCNLHMLGTKALENWAHIRHNEMGHTIGTMLEVSSKGKPVMLAELLSYAMANMIGEVMLGERVFEETGTEAEEFKDMVVELMTLAGLVNVGDYLPMLAWMDLQGIEGRMKKLRKKFDVMLTRMIKKHTETAQNRKGKPDLLDAIMANRDNSVAERLSDDSVKAVLLDLFTAGTDTSSSTIEWAIAEMLKNPTIMKRAQYEMDQVIGRNRKLTESDIPNLPYLRAICKESFRKHPSTPLNLPHVSSHACEVNGYYIPKKTKLLVNIWAIGRDPEVWKDPLEFNPERFLTGPASKMDPRGADFELIPFGGGRRICAGARMGVVLVEYILGVMIHSFDWENGCKNESGMMDMDEVFGLALQKKVPVSAFVSPRLAPDVYA